MNLLDPPAEYTLLPAMINLLHSITIQEHSKGTSAITASTMKIWTISVMKGSHVSHTTTKSTPFAVSKDEWDAREDTDNFMKNALDILRYANRHVSSFSNVEQRKNQALTVIELHLSEGIS